MDTRRSLHCSWTPCSSGFQSHFFDSDIKTNESLSPCRTFHGRIVNFAWILLISLLQISHLKWQDQKDAKWISNLVVLFPIPYNHLPYLGVMSQYDNSLVWILKAEINFCRQKVGHHSLEVACDFQLHFNRSPSFPR